MPNLRPRNGSPDSLVTAASAARGMQVTAEKANGERSVPCRNRRRLKNWKGFIVPSFIREIKGLRGKPECEAVLFVRAPIRRLRGRANLLRRAQHRSTHRGCVPGLR